MICSQTRQETNRLRMAFDRAKCELFLLILSPEEQHLDVAALYQAESWENFIAEAYQINLFLTLDQ